MTIEIARRTAAIGLTFLSAPVLAQQPASAPQPGTTGGLEEIIVTAQKREERLQDVPLAVTAVSGADLTERQINDTTSLVAVIPSITFQQGANPSNSNFRIRGIGTQLFGLGTEASVSVVVDGVVAARTAQGFSDLSDIERIEVLRGPQGTLFGRNATAGVINVVTARPSDQFGGSMDLTVAENEEYRVRGSVTGPLTDTARYRLAGYYNDVGGNIRNLANGQDVNGFESFGVRGKLEWDALPQLNLLFSGEYLEQNADCCASVFVNLVTPTLVSLNPGIEASLANRERIENAQTFSNSWQSTLSLTADLDLGSATITSITAFQRYFLENNNPADGFDSDPIIYIPRAEANWVALDSQGGEVDLDNFSQELRIASTGNTAFDYVAGLYYNHLEIERPFSRSQVRCNQRPVGQPQLAPLDLCPANRIAVFSSAALFNLETEHIAVFGQIEPRITEKLTGILGLRYQYEEGTNLAQQFGPINPGDLHAVNGMPGPFPIVGSESSSDSVLTGRAGLQYEFNPDSQAYVTYTRGYKGEGYSLESAVDPLNQGVLEPETVDAYEIGYKFQTGTLRTGIALFRSDFENLQVQANRGDPTLGNVAFEPVNAGASQTRGVEIEGSYSPAPFFSLAFGVTYAEATIDLDGNQCALQLQSSAPTVPANDIPDNVCVRIGTGTPFQNLRGATLNNSPEWRVLLSPRFDHDFENGMLGSVLLTANYLSSANFSLNGDPMTKQDGYALVDLTLGLHSADDRWNISLFGKNLFDEHYVTNLGHNQPMATPGFPYDITASVSRDADRYWGVSLGTRF